MPRVYDTGGFNVFVNGYGQLCRKVDWRFVEEDWDDVNHKYVVHKDKDVIQLAYLSITDSDECETATRTKLVCIDIAGTSQI